MALRDIVAWSVGTLTWGVGLAGVFYVAGVVNDKADAHRKTLPELDPNTPVTMTAAQAWCKNIQPGREITVTKDGTQFRLPCPKAH